MAVRLIRHCFTVDEYHRMGEAGIFSEDDRVELIEGEVVEMTPIGSWHASCVLRLNHMLTQKVGTRALVNVQNPIQLGAHSEPQPDLAVLRPRADFYAAGHPGPADVLLLIEVADTSADYERQSKLPLYARHGVREVWLVDLPAEVVERYRNHSPQGYQQVQQAPRGERLAVEALPGIELAVDDILGSESGPAVEGPLH